MFTVPAKSILWFTDEATEGEKKLIQISEVYSSPFAKGKRPLGMTCQGHDLIHASVLKNALSQCQYFQVYNF